MKIKKYIYPPVFSIGFLIFWEGLKKILSMIPSEGYGALGLAVLILLGWLMIVLPIYCIRYSKTIINEKFKSVFAAYNSLLIIVAHMLPFRFRGWATIVIGFILWVLLWNIVPLTCPFDHSDKEEKNAENEPRV